MLSEKGLKTRVFGPGLHHALALSGTFPENRTSNACFNAPKYVDGQISMSAIRAVWQLLPVIDLAIGFFLRNYERRIKLLLEKSFSRCDF